MAALRVLVCEDSKVYAAALRQMLEFDGDIKVPAVCGSAEEALAALPRVRPDLVTMDIELPGMDGLTAVGEIMSIWPVPILVLSGHVGRGSATAGAALAAGALDALAKDDLDLLDPAGAAGVAFRRRAKVLGGARVIRHPHARLTAGGGRASPPRPASAVGICASAGGPELLMFLLTALPADYPIPILVVQHIAVGFTERLAHWLDHDAAIPVGIAADGARARPGAWLAPYGSHLTLASTGHLALDGRAASGHHRPSGDVLLSSIAATAGRAGVAIVLSGMGQDGAAGAAEVHRCGGFAIAQDEESSAVFGMPKSAIDRGVDAVLPPEDIAACLLSLRHVPLGGSRR